MIVKSEHIWGSLNAPLYDMIVNLAWVVINWLILKEPKSSIHTRKLHFRGKDADYKHTDTRSAVSFLTLTLNRLRYHSVLEITWHLQPLWCFGFFCTTTVNVPLVLHAFQYEKSKLFEFNTSPGSRFRIPFVPGVKIKKIIENKAGGRREQVPHHPPQTRNMPNFWK